MGAHNTIPINPKDGQLANQGFGKMSDRLRLAHECSECVPSSVKCGLLAFWYFGGMFCGAWFQQPQVLDVNILSTLLSLNISDISLYMVIAGFC